MKLQQAITELKFNANGLIPVVVQADNDGTVLMQAWMNVVSLKRTIQTRQMWYWSRSRAQLWRKGATSGNTQRLIKLSIDCDRDCLLAVVEQLGVACHLGERSCFHQPIELISNQDD